MQLRKEVIISEVIFDNGKSLLVGDLFMGDRIIKLTVRKGDIVEVVFLEGHSVFYDKNGNKIN